jgi:putative aminopeptidase FrvX
MDLKALTEMHAASGDERLIRKAIADAAKPLCDEVAIDRMGNVLCRKKGPAGKPRVLLSAHMDEVGFMITGATDDGLLRIAAVGGIDPRAAVSKNVVVGPRYIPGVIGAMAIHLQAAEDRARVLPFEKLYIDIGARDKDEALREAPLGSYAYFDTPCTPFGDGYVCAKALDDRVGCLNLLKVLEGEYACDVTCAFVTQEEVGLRGAAGAGFRVQPDIAIILEGTAANDRGDVPAALQVCGAGKGVAVSFMDNASIADRDLFRQMLTLAEKHGIPHQVKQGITGGNDAGAYQLAGRGARTCVLSVPCRYIHGAAGVACLADVEAQGALAIAFLQNI